jgi:predicted acetyltransferase
MMRDLLDASHEWGELVAYLWVCEDLIYGRFGLGLASFTGVPCERSMRRPLRRVAFPSFRRPPPKSAAQIYERMAAVTSGMFERSSDWWRNRTLADPDWLVSSIAMRSS